MKILQLHIYLFTWYQATESLTNRIVILGDDVTINCDLDIEEIYWYMLKLPDPPVLILRSFSSTFEGAEYENSHFKHKYFLQSNSSLLIKNITIEDVGVYYCVKTDAPLKFSNGTKLYFTDQTEPKATSWRTLTITSSVLNVLLIIAVMGLVKRYVYLARAPDKTLQTPQHTNPWRDQYTNDPQYAEIEFSMHHSGTGPRQEQSTYSLLQPMHSLVH